MNINDDIAGFSDFDQKSNPPTFRKPNLGSPHDVSFVTSLDDSKTVRALSLGFGYPKI